MIEGVRYELPDDVTKAELASLIIGDDFVIKNKNEVTVHEQMDVAPGDAFKDGFAMGEEVVDESGVKFKVDKYGRYIEV